MHFVERMVAYALLPRPNHGNKRESVAPAASIFLWSLVWSENQLGNDDGFEKNGWAKVCPAAI
jgi:hypothetical protein